MALDHHWPDGRWRFRYFCGGDAQQNHRQQEEFDLHWATVQIRIR